MSTGQSWLVRFVGVCVAPNPRKGRVAETDAPDGVETFEGLAEGPSRVSGFCCFRPLTSVLRSLVSLAPLQDADNDHSVRGPSRSKGRTRWTRWSFATLPPRNLSDNAIPTVRAVWEMRPDFARDDADANDFLRGNQIEKLRQR